MVSDSANPPYPEETPTGTKIIRNVGFGALRVLLVAPVPLLLTPFIIKHVGTKGLGLWTVFLAVNALTSLADLGFLGTLTKHVSEHYATRDYLSLNRVINAGLVIFMAAALVFVIAINAGSGLLVSGFLRQAPLPPAEVQHCVRLLSIALALNLLVFPFSSIITGLQRLDFSNLLSAVNAVGIAVAAAVFLALGFAINGLVYAIVLGAGLNFALSLLVAWRLLPQLRISPALVRREDIKSLFAFSAKLYTTQVAVLVHNQTEKFLLAHFAGLTPAGWYDVGNDLSLKLRGIPSLLLSPLLPAASELEARGEHEKTVILYRRTHKYLAFVGVLITFVTGLLAQRFVQIWLGPSFAQVAFALVILTAVQFVNLASGPGLMILIGKGDLLPGVRSALAGIILNLTLSTVFIMRYGFPGAVFGTALSLSLASIYFIVMFHQRTGYPFYSVVEPYIKPFVWGAVLTLIGERILPLSRFHWTGLVVTALGFGCIYLGGLLVLKYFDAFDIRALERLFAMRKVIGRASDVA